MMARVSVQEVEPSLQRSEQPVAGEVQRMDLLGGANMTYLRQPSKASKTSKNIDQLDDIEERLDSENSSQIPHMH